MARIDLIAEARRLAGLSQRELAERAGTSQPAVARLEQGHSSPSLATLERLLAAAGFALRLELVPLARTDPLIEAFKRDVDRTLLRENLRRTMDERLRTLEEFNTSVVSLRDGVRAAKKAGKVAEPDPPRARTRRR